MERPIYLKVSFFCLKLLGIWSLEAPASYEILNKIHYVYSRIVVGFFLTIHFCTYIEIYTLSMDEKYLETTGIFGVALLYVVNFMKLRVIYRVDAIGLMERITRLENIYMSSKYDKIRDLYEKSRKWNYFVALFMFFGGYITIIPYLINPLWIEHFDPPQNLTYVVNNVTLYKWRPLPMQFYTPFDKFKYYYCSYIISAFYPIIGAGWTTACDGTLYALYMFTVLQLKCIQHQFENIKKYAADIRLENHELTVEESIRIQLGRCIEEHKTLMQFAIDLDDKIGWTMFSDFIIASIRLAMVGFQLMAGVSSLMQVSAVQYVAIMSCELFFYYWNANEIIIESLNVGNAVWNSEWYDFGTRTKLDIMIILMRCQIPIMIHCGPIYAMSTQTLTSVFKGSYSYGMLMIKSK